MALRKGSVVVIGGGKFGKLAVQRLKDKVSLLVEPEPDAELLDLGVPVIREDGVKAAVDLMSGPEPPRWLVPALPRHFLAEWLAASLAGFKTKRLPPPDVSSLDITMVHKDGEGRLYLSLADFMCPDDCPEPAGHCTVTGKPRGKPLYRRLMEIREPGRRNAVTRSRQLAPGVGGLAGEALLKLREQIENQPGDWIIGTACLCHGVIEALGFSKMDSSG